MPVLNSPSFLEIIEVPAEDRKTKLFEVYAKNRMAKLGEVRFYGAWRKYVFSPNGEVLAVFDSGCLREIAEFCDERTKEWRLAAVTP